MSRGAFVVIAVLLLGSGCRLRDVNDVSPIDYRADESVPLIVAKSSGNLVPWVLVGSALTAFYTLAAAPQLVLLAAQAAASH